MACVSAKQTSTMMGFYHTFYYNELTLSTGGVSLGWGYVHYEYTYFW